MTSSSSRIWRIGLTGGIGSGKSTVATMLAQRGAAIIDADALSRSLTAAGGLAMPAIRAQFGADMVAPDGAMDRQAMRQRAFTDPQALRQLEAIIHPLVSQLTRKQAEQALATGARCLVFDVPLLVENGARWRGMVDRVLVVDCHANTQRQRVAVRNGLPMDEIDRILTRQATRQQRLACADTVIYNDGLSLQELETEVRQMALHFGL
jgi:dephospho-CoA kinase